MKTNSEKQNLTGGFRQLLQSTLIERCKMNPAYSLRAFAKQLDLEPSFLSKLISGKRNVTQATIEKLSLKLSLTPEETREFVETPSKDHENYQNLALDHFKMIADWYHYAILELIEVKGFESDANWISKRLGIKKIEAQAALERLERLEMIVKDKKGRYQNASGNNTTVSNDFTAVAFKKLQKQVLLQALDALENTPLELRDQSSMTMSIDPALLPEAKKKLKDFRREFCSVLQNNFRPKREVYQLSLSFFPVSKPQTTPNKRGKNP